MADQERWLRGEAAKWLQEGLIDTATWEKIQERYPVPAGDDAPRRSLAMRTFFTLGGFLLGAAVFALWALLGPELQLLPDTEASAWWFFAVFTAVWCAAGVAVLTIRKDPDLGQVFLLAGLVQSVALAGPDPGWSGAWFAAPLVAAALLWYRRMDTVVPVAAALALQVTLGISLGRTFDETATWSALWLVATTLLLAGMLTWNHLRQPPWSQAGSAIAGLGFAAAWIAFTFEVILDGPNFIGDAQTVIAIGLAALLGLGIWRADRPLVYVGGLGLVVDAVAFAFDVGGVVWGLTMLLLLAVGLVVLAVWLRRRGAPRPSP